MPMLIAKKYMMKKTARFFHEKKKRAAMAPTWKSPMAMVVIQLMRPCWCSRPMRRSCLIFWVTSATAGTTVASLGAVFTGTASMVLRGVMRFGVLELQFTADIDANRRKEFAL